MLDRLKDKACRRFLFTIVKYVFAVVLTLLTYSTTKNPIYVGAGLIELAFIFVLFNVLVDVRFHAHLIADFLYFTYVAQMLVLYFGNSYTTLTMLKNVKFLKDLGGRAVAYILGTVIVLAIVFLPGKCLLKKVNKKILYGILAVLLVLEIGIHVEYKRFSPVQSFGTIIADEIRYQKVKRAQVNPDIALETYYRSDLEDAIAKPSELPENPNLIVIFTEGLSYNIIQDERDIMPNLKAFEDECLSFDNYYNHTFPTLRGVQGQLYSGYKLNDDALGNNLISLQGILKEKGYNTSFINVEPFNEEFNNYCDNLGFDNVITDTENVSGYVKSMTDEGAYKLLFDSANELHDGDQPFFLSMYSFGTHVSFDSTGFSYGDGNDAVLNRFYNLDRQFGTFIEAFKQSDLAQDTIIVFTTDHCTYADQDYAKAFPDYHRECTDVDVIPLFVYYDGIEAEKVDVNGKNSLCLTPTILDYLDINQENYFLGTSLFDDNANSDFDTMFYDASYLVSTKDGEVRYLSDMEIDSFLSKVLAYYTAVEAQP